MKNQENDILKMLALQAKMSDVEKMRYTLSVSEKYRNFVDQCSKEIV